MSSYGQNAVRPETDVCLSFQVSKTAINAAASTCGIRLTPNGAFDVDPILGSTNTPGFSEYAALYNYYRVVKVEYDLEICNLETFPVRAYTFFANTDPGTVGNFQFPGGPYCKSHLLAGKTGTDLQHFKDSKLVATVVGTSAVEKEDNFRAAVTANPVDLIWLGIAGNSVAGAFLPNGIAIAGQVRMYTRFYDAKVLFN